MSPRHQSIKSIKRPPATVFTYYSRIHYNVGALKRVGAGGRPPERSGLPVQPQAVQCGDHAAQSPAHYHRKPPHSG